MLKYLGRHYRDWGIPSLAVPPLGCGQGQLEWRVVGPTLYRYFSRLDIPVICTSGGMESGCRGGGVCSAQGGVGDITAGGIGAPGEGIRIKDALEAFLRYTDKPMLASPGKP